MRFPAGFCDALVYTNLRFVVSQARAVAIGVSLLTAAATVSRTKVQYKLLIYGLF
jgi:hypothetical protein